MNVAAWTLSFVLAIPLAVIGVAKIIQQPSMVTTSRRLGIGPGPYRLVGVAEVAGGFGLLIGAVAGGSADWVGFFAAIGLIAITIGAVYFHRRAGDSVNEMIPAMVLGLLCLSYLIALAARPFETSTRLPTIAASAILTT